jgi:hypothetical protein
LAEQGKLLRLSQHCPITVTIPDETFKHTNLYILIVQSTFSHDINAKLTEKIEIKAFIALPCLAGAPRVTKQSLQELWVIDREVVENFL